MDTKQPCLQAENEQLRAGYDAARLEIESLRERVQQLGQLARDVTSRRVVELEAQLAAVGAGGVEPLRKRCLHQISEPAQAQPVDLEPVAAQSRFLTEKGWGTCTLEHHLYVKANPAEWPGYETRALYAAPQSAALAQSAAPRNAPLYDPDDVAFSACHNAKGVDALPPELASTAAEEVAAVEVAAPSAPAREPLTDEQIDEIHLANSDAYERGDVEYESHGFARAIEHHHGITAAQKGGQHAE